MTRNRCLLLGIWIVATAALFHYSFVLLFRYLVEDSDLDYIFLIPAISLFFLWRARKAVLVADRVSTIPSLPFFVCGILAIAFAHNYGTSIDPLLLLSLNLVSLVLFWLAGFVFLFGYRAFQSASFPLLLFLLGIPPPPVILQGIVVGLQRGSAEMSGHIFELLGIPFLREGMVFLLPKVSIEVASECSGIRSSMAILVLALVASHIFLRTFWKKAFFVSIAVVVMIVKNAVRIVTLTLLANYVNQDFLYGNLHKEGGLFFFVLGLLLLVPVLRLLQRSELPKSANDI